MPVLHQVANAISMVFPLLAVFRHRRTASVLRRIVPFHAPISAAYHLSMAFPHKLGARLTRFLFSTDILLIHVTSLATSCEYRKRKGLANNIALRAFLLPAHVLSLAHTVFYRDIPILRCSLVVMDHIHLLKRRNRVKIVRKALLAAFFFLASYQTHLQGSHALFHALLYPMYDEYIKIVASRALL